MHNYMYISVSDIDHHLCVGMCVPVSLQSNVGDVFAALKKSKPWFVQCLKVSYIFS